MAFSLNAKNYNSVRNYPSVHYGRSTIAARYHNNAMMKAISSTPMPASPAVVVMQPQTEHRSTISQIFGAITTGVTGFLGGFGIGSGNTNMASAGMMGCMGAMGGMGSMMGGGSYMMNGYSNNMMSMQGSLFGGRFMC